MHIKSLGAAAAVALLISGAALAQQPMQQQPAQTPPASNAPAAGPAMAPAPASTAPVPATPVPDVSRESKMTEAAPTPKPHLSGCQLAIKASEKALDKSQASPETIASAWQHISTAKQEKGSACKDEAKAAQEML
jgi:hypothetical protein